MKENSQQESVMMINDTHIAKNDHKLITKKKEKEKRMMKKAWLESHAVYGFFQIKKVPHRWTFSSPCEGPSGRPMPPFTVP